MPLLPESDVSNVLQHLDLTELALLQTLFRAPIVDEIGGSLPRSQLYAKG